MKKSELEEMIRLEVQRQVKSIVPKMVKPLVQEAVAGALATLLAEGIAKGPPAPIKNNVLTPNVPQTRQAPVRTEAVRTEEDAERIRSGIRNKMRSVQESPSTIGISPNSYGGGMVGNILAETASSMTVESNVESVLDASDQLEEAVDSQTVAALTRDYSALMQRMKSLGKLNG